MPFSAFLHSNDVTVSTTTDEFFRQPIGLLYHPVPTAGPPYDAVKPVYTSDPTDTYMRHTETEFCFQNTRYNFVTERSPKHSIKLISTPKYSLSTDPAPGFLAPTLTLNQTSPEMNVYPVFSTLCPTQFGVDSPLFTCSSSSLSAPTTCLSWPLSTTLHSNSIMHILPSPTFVSKVNSLSNFCPYFQCTAPQNMPVPTAQTSPQADFPVAEQKKTTSEQQSAEIVLTTAAYDFNSQTSLRQPTLLDRQAGAHHVSMSPGLTNSSMSDISLNGLEELLARTSVNDVYVGPSHGKDGNLVLLDPCVDTDGVLEHEVPYSSSSLAFAPPGILMVTELWPMFLEDRLSHCNHRILNMKFDSLRQCLYDHGLNQRGSLPVLRRRLQEFVRRVRDAQNTETCRINKSNQIDILTHKTDDSCSDTGTVTDKTVEKQKGFTPPCLSDSEDPAPSPLSPTPDLKSTSTRRASLPRPVVLTPDTFYSYLLIIDLEATCDSQDKSESDTEYPHEIIEFPILLYDTRSRRCVGVFHAYCRPRLRPDLTSFCTSLTQISQVQVDNSYPFPYVLEKVEEWLLKKHKLSGVRCAVVCDCSADMGKFMRIQCRLNKLSIPPWANVWINLSKAFRIFYKIPSRYRVTLKTMLRDLSLSFVGQHHRGLDDAINILRVVRVLLADGCHLRVNERTDLGKGPTFVTSVPRTVAESTAGIMGSRLVLLSRKCRSNNVTIATGKDADDPFKNGTMPDNIPEAHRQSLLWLANVRKTRVNWE